MRFYGAGSIAQIIVNLCLITGTVIAGFAPTEQQAEYLAWAVFASAIAQYVLVAHLSKRIGYPVKLIWPTISPAIRQLLFLMIPALFGAAVYQLNIIITTALASLLPEGMIAWLFYAQ